MRIPKGGLEMTRGKSPAAVRDVPLPPFAAELLRRHRTEQKKRRLMSGEAWQSDLVLEDGVGGPLNPDGVSHAFLQARRAAGIDKPIRLHDCRHYFCTELVASNKMNPKAVSEIAGHSSVAFTLAKYVDPREDETRVAAQVMDSLGALLGE